MGSAPPQPTLTSHVSSWAYGPVTCSLRRPFTGVHAPSLPPPPATHHCTRISWANQPKGRALRVPSSRSPEGLLGFAADGAGALTNSGLAGQLS